MRAVVGALQARVARLEGAAKRAAPRDDGPDRNERLLLRERPDLQCAHCGRLHFGQCTRVAKVTVESRPNHLLTSTEYWPNDKWEPPADSFSPSEIWGDQPPPQPERKDASAPPTEQAADA